MAKKTTKSDLAKGETTVGESAPARKGGTIIAKKITPKLIQKLGMDAKMRVAGIVTKTESVTTQYGESVRFIGDIAAQVMEDGKTPAATIRAGACFLPRQAEGIVSAGLASHINDENFRGVEFALEIGKEPSKASKTGYEWTVKTLVDTEQAEDKVLLLLGA